MKILVADDYEPFRDVLAAKLVELGHVPTLVSNGCDAAEELARNDYSVLICDWLMPGMDGPELCRKIRAEARLNYVYIILITSMCGESDYHTGIAAGADDFMKKPFDAELLASRLHAAERILAMNQQLLERALHDRLTGLLNRGAIIDGLHQEIHRASREGRGLAVMMIDVDHFKDVNDTYGHPAGDSVLQEAARRMQMSFRPYDRVGRYGGEEFLLVAPCANTAHASKLAERLRLVIGSSPIAAGESRIDVTVSVGVVATRAEPDIDPSALIALADAALYRAKKLGRNRVEVVDYFPSVRRRLRSPALSLVREA